MCTPSEVGCVVHPQAVYLLSLACLPLMYNHRPIVTGLGSQGTCFNQQNVGRCDTHTSKRELSTYSHEGGCSLRRRPPSLSGEPWVTSSCDVSYTRHLHLWGLEGWEARRSSLQEKLTATFPRSRCDFLRCLLICSLAKATLDDSKLLPSSKSFFFKTVSLL